MVGAAAAVDRVVLQAEQSQLAEASEQVVRRELPGGLPRIGVRVDLLGNQVADGLAEQVVFLGELQHGWLPAFVDGRKLHPAPRRQHRGERLGGNTGPYALRAMGKDTFLFSRDVEAYLRAYQIVEGSSIHGLGNLKRIQAQFNQWQQQSGWSLQQISRLIAFSTGDNVAGLTGAALADDAEEMA